MIENIFNYHLDKRGVLLVSDKTSYAVGINSLGERLSIGGWGTRLNDDGSEYYIGLNAVRAVISEYEMMDGRTMLTEGVKKRLKIESINELRYAFYYRKLTENRICTLSSEVLRCAQKGDRISVGIINKAAEKLFNMVDIIIRRLNMYDSEYKLYFAGSTCKFGAYIIEPLYDKIYSRYDNIEIITYNNLEDKGLGL
jgi:N-acetylglucosamine kinase-like BadF-type ATPase